MKKRNLIAFLLSFTILATLTMCGFMMFGGANAQETDVNEIIENIESEYRIGSTINIPDAYFADGDEHIKAEKMVICPDGTSYCVNKFSPNAMGLYYIEYSANTSEGYCSKRKEVYVYDNLYSVKSNTDTLYYGTNDLTPNTYGLNVGLEEGSTFYYNEPIDLNALGNKPFISMYMAPEKAKEADGLDLVIRLTDAYDEDNYVDIWLRCTRESSTWQHGATYISAGASNQERVGVEFGSKIHRENLWGFGQDFTFFGVDTKTGEVNEDVLTSTTKKNGQLRLFLNLDTKVLSTQGSVAGYKEVTDLDNLDYYTDLWQGFTTGEAYLSITAKALSKTHMNFVLTEIGGNDLTVNKTTDNGEPLINVDTLEYDELPNAVIGIPYPIFDATAKDAYSGDIDVDVAVYMNYGSPSQTDVNIVDGKFIPTIAGKYYIVYSAKDDSNNCCEKILEITCLNTSEDIVVNISNKDKVISAYLGEYVKLPGCTVSGGNGKLTTSVTVTDPMGDEVEVIDNEFKALLDGNYTVCYKATDFIGNFKECSYYVTTTSSVKPIFDKDPTFQKFFISGYDYVMPELKAFDYSIGGEEVDVAIKINDDEGERILGDDRKANFVINNAGEVKTFSVTYTATNSVGSSEKTYNVCVVNAKKPVSGVQRLDVAKYFYSDTVKIDARDTSVALNTSSEGSVEFINTLIASGFNMKFSMTNTSKLGALKITLVDSADDFKRVEILLKNGGSEKTKYIINNSKSELGISIPYTGGEFDFIYDNDQSAISLDKSNYVSVKTYTDGSIFNGFPSKKIRLYIEFVDVKGETEIAVTEINSQGLKNSTIMDRVSPWVVTESIGDRMKNVGDVVTIKPAIASDVLDPSVQLSVTVYDPDSKPVTSTSGVLLKDVSGSDSYQFALSVYGNYRISYTAVDSAGNKTVYPILINVIDRESPVITLERQNISTAKKGATIVVAPITVSDNNTPSEEIVVCCFVVRPCGMRFYVDLNESNSFVATETGTYCIRYVAFDALGNITTIENKIVVTQ